MKTARDLRARGVYRHIRSGVEYRIADGWQSMSGTKARFERDDQKHCKVIVIDVANLEFVRLEGGL